MSKNPQSLHKLLQRIKESPPPEQESEIVGKQEERAFREQLECDKLAAEIAGIKQDIEERKSYASKTFRLICYWLAGVFALLLFQGFLGENPSYNIKLASGFEWKIKFNLGDNVLMAVVGGTTVSVIGIFVYVVKYLFSKR
jgi:hypothetical protein